jgi:hypothetical protein
MGYSHQQQTDICGTPRSERSSTLTLSVTQVGFGANGEGDQRDPCLLDDPAGSMSSDFTHPLERSTIRKE